MHLEIKINEEKAMRVINNGVFYDSNIQVVH